MSTVAYGSCQHTLAQDLANELDTRANTLLSRSQDNRYTRAQRASFARGAATLTARANQLRDEAQR